MKPFEDSLASAMGESSNGGKPCARRGCAASLSPLELSLERTTLNFLLNARDKNRKAGFGLGKHWTFRRPKLLRQEVIGYLLHLPSRDAGPRCTAASSKKQLIVGYLNKRVVPQVVEQGIELDCDDS